MRVPRGTISAVVVDDSQHWGCWSVLGGFLACSWAAVSGLSAGTSFLLWYPGPWYSGTLVLWYPGFWYWGTLVPWYPGTVVPWYWGTGCWGTHASVPLSSLSSLQCFVDAGVERSVYYSSQARDRVASLIQSSKEFAFVTSIRSELAHNHICEKKWWLVKWKS